MNKSRFGGNHVLAESGSRALTTWLLSRRSCVWISVSFLLLSFCRSTRGWSARARADETLDEEFELLFELLPHFWAPTSVTPARSRPENERYAIQVIWTPYNIEKLINIILGCENKMFSLYVLLWIYVLDVQKIRLEILTILYFDILLNSLYSLKMLYNHTIFSLGKPHNHPIHLI